MAPGRSVSCEPSIVCFVSHKCETNDARNAIVRGPPTGARRFSGQTVAESDIGDTGSSNNRRFPCTLMQGSRLGDVLRSGFSTQGIQLLIDPFQPGVGVGARIENLDFQALLFLSSPESLASPWCRVELSVARQRGIPLFVIRRAGEVPVELQQRVILDAVFEDDEWDRAAGRDFADRLQTLAAEMRIRAELWKRIALLGAQAGDAGEQRRIAIEVEDADPTAITELIGFLDRCYSLQLDEAARASLARALGRTGSPAAVTVLRRWAGIEDHPYGKRAIRESLQALGLRTEEAGTFNR